MSFKPICCQCGGPRSPSSGMRCRNCYQLNARAKKDANIEYIPPAFPEYSCSLQDMLLAEKRGEMVFTPDAVCFPEDVTEEDMENFPWLRVLKDGVIKIDD